MSTVKIRFAPGLKPVVVKHAEHDQSSHGSWAGTNEITSDQKKAVQAYTQKLGDVAQWRSAAQNIRDGKTPDAPPEFVSSVKTLLNAIDEHSVTPTNAGGKVLLRSGVNWKGKLPAVGEIMSNPVASATWRHNVAEKFASSGDGKPVIIKYGSSTKGLDTSKFGTYLFGDEGEFIVSGKFEVVNRDKENGFTYVSVRPVGEVAKHAMHDQSTHGNWAGGGTSAGNNLGIEEVMKLQNKFDPLQEKVYAAERVLSDGKINSGTKPKAPSLDDYILIEDYDKEYKAYNKKFTDWAVEQQAYLLSDRAKTILNGSPAGVKKYVEEIVKADWFVERFGDGSSLPPLQIQTTNTNAAGRHILGFSRNPLTRQIEETKHIISIDRQSTKNETVLLHEISHFATSISQTTPYAPHGVEFAQNFVYVVGKAISPERAASLKKSFIAKGVLIDN